MQLAFGDSFNAGVALGLAEDWAKGDFSNLPKFEIHSKDEINGANGAFAAATNTIYLSREFLRQNANNLEAVTSVLLEEIGHAVDARLNPEDSSGDEGAIFSALVRGETLTPQNLQHLRAENDLATTWLDGDIAEIEKNESSLDSGESVNLLANFRLFGEVNRFSFLGFGDMFVSFGFNPTGPALRGTEIGRIEYPVASSPFTRGVLAPLSLPSFGFGVVDFKFSVPFTLEVGKDASMFIGLGTNSSGSGSPAGPSGSKQVILDFSDNISFGGTQLGGTLDQGLSLRSITLADGRSLAEVGLQFDFIPENTTLTAFASAADDLGQIAPLVATAPGTENRAAVFPFSGTANSKLRGGINRGGSPPTEELVNLDVNPEPNPLVFDVAGASIGGTNNVRLTPIDGNNSPVANNDAVTTDEDTLVKGNVLTNDSDPNNDPLTVTEVNGKAADVGQKITLASEAFLTLKADGTFDYDPNGKFEALKEDETATDSFNYTISDGKGGTSTAKVTVTIKGVSDNNNPVAADDAVTTDEDTLVKGNVLTNDSDPNNDPLTVTEVNGKAADVGQKITLASGAFLTLKADGTFDYDPNGQFEALNEGDTASDSFDYTISDGKGGTSTATVTVTITGVNDPATISGTATAAVTEDTNVDGNGKLNATGSLTVTDVDAGEDKFNTSVTSATGNLGNLSITENGTFSYSVDNSAVQSLGADKTKTDIFTVKSFDGTASQNINVTITGVNDAPVAQEDSYITQERTALTINAPGVLSNDSDVDGDTLSVFDFDAASVFGGTVAINSDGSFTYTPEEQFAGIDRFSYTISDGNGGSDTADVVVTVKTRNQRSIDIDSLTGLRSNSSTISGYFDISNATDDPGLKVQLETLGMTYDRKEGKGGKGKWIDVDPNKYETTFWIDTNQNGILDSNLGEKLLPDLNPSTADILETNIVFGSDISIGYQSVFEGDVPNPLRASVSVEIFERDKVFGFTESFDF
jgi:VCBS repeat-containing protein